MAAVARAPPNKDEEAAAKAKIAKMARKRSALFEQRRLTLMSESLVGSEDASKLQELQQQYATP